MICAFLKIFSIKPSWCFSIGSSTPRSSRPVRLTSTQTECLYRLSAERNIRSGMRQELLAGIKPTPKKVVRRHHALPSKTN